MEINEDIIAKIFELANKKVEIEKVTITDIKKALINIEQKLNFYADTTILHSEMKINLLIVDDLELSIFQFAQLLQKIGTKPSVARSKEEAIAEIRKKKFDFLVIDLFLPDLVDGITLIEELIKYKNETEQNYRIIAISSTDDENIIKQVYSLGVDEFVSKSEKWHLEVVKYIAEHYNVVKNEDFSMFICENNISVYTLNKLNSISQKDELLQDITKSIYTEKKNIILNVKNLRYFQDEFTSVFAEIYKMCTDAGGKFVLVSPTPEIIKALKNYFLYDLIKIEYSVNDAIMYTKD